MATLSTLTVDIRTNSAKFNQGMDKAQRRLKRFTGGVKRASQSLARLFKRVSLSALVGGGIFALITKQSLSAIDNVGKLSKRLGISTKALSEYKLVAEQSGISFTNLTLAFQRMTRRVAEASVDLGEARGALKELGLDAAELSTLAPDQQFERIADALQGVTSSSDKLRIAFKLFDSEGVAVLQTMENGAAGIRAMRDEAKRFGLSLSQDAVRGVESANDSMTRLGFVFVGIRDQIVSKLAPGLDTLVTKIRESILAAADAQGGIGKFAENIAKGILSTFKTSVQGIKSLGNGLDTVLTRLGLKQASTAEELGRQLDGTLERINGLFAKIREAEADLADGTGLAAKFGLEYTQEDLNDFKSKLAEALEFRDELVGKIAGASDNAGALDGVITGIDTLIAGLGKAAPAYEPLNQAIKKNVVNLKAEAEALKAQQALLAEGQSVFDATRTPVEALSIEFVRLNELLDAGAINWDTYSRAILNAQDEFDSLADTAKETENEIGEFALEAARNIQQSFADFLFDPFDKGVSGMVDAFDVAIRKMIANAAAAQLSKYFFGDFDKTGEIGGIFGGIIPGFANGTNYAPGGLALVGERGPEIVNLPRGSTVTPNEKLGGSTTNVFNFTVSGQTDRRSQQQIADAAYRGVTRANQRNG